MSDECGVGSGDARLAAVPPRPPTRPLVCGLCGYPVDGVRCSECGAAVSAGDDPELLRRVISAQEARWLVRGLGILARAPLVLGGAFIGFMVVLSAAMLTGSDAVMRVLFWLLMAAAWVAAVMWFGGVWMVARAECVRGSAAAVWARGGVVAAVGAGVLYFLLVAWLPRPVHAAAGCIAAVGSGVSAAGVFAVCGRLWGVTQRARYKWGVHRRPVAWTRFVVMTAAAAAWSALVCVEAALGGVPAGSTWPGSPRGFSTGGVELGALLLAGFAWELVSDVRRGVVEEVVEMREVAG